MSHRFDPAAARLTQTAAAKSFGGWTKIYRHDSAACRAPMTFGVYLPPQAEQGPCPVVYWLSGLTCSEQNFLTKAGAQRYAAELGLVLVVPDTSPRATGTPGESDSWDLGVGASYYVNATTPGWREHYQMFDYVTDELPRIVGAHFPIDCERASIAGHSMGGHGALVAALRLPGRYRAVSAFAPIAAAASAPWGEKAFTALLGAEPSAWRAYDASELALTSDAKLPILIDQGSRDEFLTSQLMPERLRAACERAGRPLEFHLRDGYDHSYYFVATFIGEHLAWHAERLR